MTWTIALGANHDLVVGEVVEVSTLGRQGIRAEVLAVAPYSATLREVAGTGDGPVFYGHR